MSAEESFNDLVDTVLMADKGKTGNNDHLNELLLWYDRKKPIDVKEDKLNISNFIKKYYDPDEVTQVDAS